jgi:hypothetical protein
VPYLHDSRIASTKKAVARSETRIESARAEIKLARCGGRSVGPTESAVEISWSGRPLRPTAEALGGSERGRLPSEPPPTAARQGPPGLLLLLLLLLLLEPSSLDRRSIGLAGHTADGREREEEGGSSSPSASLRAEPDGASTGAVSPDEEMRPVASRPSENIRERERESR